MHAAIASYYDAVADLARMGVVLGAVVAWPAVPCNASWVRNPAAAMPHHGTTFLLSSYFALNAGACHCCHLAQSLGERLEGSGDIVFFVERGGGVRLLDYSCAPSTLYHSGKVSSMHTYSALARRVWSGLVWSQALAIEPGKTPPKQGASMTIPWTYLRYKKFHPFGPSLDRMRCEWGALAPHGE